jgi:hypothetical protein
VLLEMSGIAPVTGGPKVVAASGAILKALGFAITSGDHRADPRAGGTSPAGFNPCHPSTTGR